MTGRTDLMTIAPALPATVTVARTPLAITPRRMPRVRASLWRLRTHLDGRRAKYRLRVENRSPETVETLTYAHSAVRPTQAGAAIAFAVPPGAVLSVSLLLELPRERPARVVTEAFTQAGTLVFEESARPRQGMRLLFAACLTIAAVVATLWGSGLLEPRITALAAPRHVIASRPFAVAYALAHANVATYSIVSGEGVEAGQGSLAAAEGSFDVALPHESEPHEYAIRLSAHSRFGDAVRTLRVLAEPDPRPIVVKRAVRPRPAPAALAIERLALERDSVLGGRPIVVYYRAGSSDGMVRLIDQAGTVRAEALLGRRGNSILLAPFVDADQDFRVVVTANKGTQQTEKSVPVRVTKAHSLDNTLATARRTGDGPIALVEQTVASGDPIEIGIVRYEPGLRIALVDPQGLEIAASSVTSDENEVTLTAPAVAERARYAVTATFKNGVSEETVIRNLTIGVPPPPPAPVP